MTTFYNLRVTVWAMKLTLSALMTTSIISINIFAQSISLDSIEIIDSQSSTTVKNETIEEEITEEKISNSQINSLDDILKLSNSAVSVGGPRTSAEGIQIRGMDSNKIFTYVDGVKQGFSSDHSSMVAIDPDNIKSAKIFTTNASVSEGTSIGGGVKFVTKDAADFLKANQNLGAIIKLGYQGSNNERSLNSRLYGKEKKSSYLLNFGKRVSRDLRLGGDEVLPNSSYEDTNFSGKYSYKLKANSVVKLFVEKFKRIDDAPLNPLFNPPNIEEFMDLNGSNEINRSTYSIDFTNKNTSFKYYEMEQSSLKTRRSDQSTEYREIKTNGINLNQKILISSLEVLVGSEIIIDEINGEDDSRSVKGLGSYPNGKSQQVGLYTQTTIAPIKKLAITPSLRANLFKVESNRTEFETKDYKNLSKNLSINYKPLKFLSLNSTYSEGFNGPRVQEIFIDGLHSPTDGFAIKDNFFIPNFDLVAETSKTYEFGAKVDHSFQASDLLSVSFSQYFTYAKNYIYLERIDRSILDDENGSTQFVNIPNAKIKGLELKIDYLINDFEFNISYTRSRGIHVERAMYLSQFPADTYRANVSHKFYDQGIDIGYSLLLANKQDRINRNTIERTDETPGYNVHGVFLNKAFRTGFLEGLTLKTKIDNLTNRRYRKHGTFLKETGLDYKLAMSYQF